ncbi:MAG: YggT family protein [Peptococcaceae bacterium]|nr:YggT family protein [Peptococcaceae bacterium]
MVINILEWAIIARAILSWFPRTHGNPLVGLLNEITDPLIRPFQRIRIGGTMAMINFAPFFALIALILIRTLILPPVYSILARIILT